MTKSILIPILLAMLFLYCDELVLTPKNADTSIINISLNDKISSQHVLGDSIPICEIGQFDYDDYASMPHISYYNKNRDQILTLITHPGSNKNSFSQIVVRDSLSSNEEPIYHLDAVDSFVSGKYIELGLSREDVLIILGTDFICDLRNENREIIEFLINDSENSEFLQAHNSPGYYGRYIFENNILIEFYFGFIYP